MSDNPTPAYWPVLYKHSSKGTVQWSVAVEADSSDHAVLLISYGKVGGKLVVKEEVFTEGKNLGKKNETTAARQAVLEAESRWKRQQEREHYGLDPGATESAAKRAAAPMLAHSYKKWDRKKNDWVLTGEAKKVKWEDTNQQKFMQPKMDGHRLLASGGRLYSRKGEDVTDALPQIVAAVAEVFPGDLVDGELYKHGVPVTTIGGWVRGRKPEALGLQYHVYDLVRSDPFDVRSTAIGTNFYARGDAGGVLVKVQTRPVGTENELIAYQNECISSGYEGAMLRWGDKGYESGKRSDSLLKVKSTFDGEFEVVGVKEGDGGIAVFECVTDEGHVFGATAPGTHAEKRNYLRTANKWIGKMLTVKYPSWTVTEKPVPFQPTAKCFREDI